MFATTLFHALCFIFVFGPFAATAVPLGFLLGPMNSVSNRGSPRQVSAFLNAHNVVRAAHNATALQWSPTLAEKAEYWADQCQFKHTDGVLSNELYGENIVAGTGDFSVASAVSQFVADKGALIFQIWYLNIANASRRDRIQPNTTLPIPPTFFSPRSSGNRPPKSAVPSLNAVTFLINLSGLHLSMFACMTPWGTLSDKRRKLISYFLIPMSCQPTK